MEPCDHFSQAGADQEQGENEASPEAREDCDADCKQLHNCNDRIPTYKKDSRDLSCLDILVMQRLRAVFLLASAE